MLATIDPSKRVQLKVADGRVVTSDAIDTAPVKLINSTTGRLEEIILHHVMYHPSFSHNLLSVRWLWQDSRIAVQFDNLKNLQCYSSGGRYRFTYDNGYNYIVPCQHLLRTMVSIPSIGDLGIVAIATFAGWFIAVRFELQWNVRT